MGLRSATLGELVFDDVFVPEEAVLGGEGGGGVLFNESMEWERACLVACHVGTMQRIVEGVVSYATTRISGGQPIGKLQAVSHKIAEMKVQLEASRLLAYKAAWQIGHSRTAGLDATIAKLYGSESLKSMALDAVQIMGGHGYLKDHAAERVLRDAVAATIYSGTSEIQRNIIASWLKL
jgi:alkylation response protein AidB-like acyl-CoA dehydrogenase